MWISPSPVYPRTFLHHLRQRISDFHRETDKSVPIKNLLSELGPVIFSLPKAVACPLCRSAWFQHHLSKIPVSPQCFLRFTISNTQIQNWKELMFYSVYGFSEQHKGFRDPCHPAKYCWGAIGLDILVISKRNC